MIYLFRFFLFHSATERREASHSGFVRRAYMRTAAFCFKMMKDMGVSSESFVQSLEELVQSNYIALSEEVP